MRDEAGAPMYEQPSANPVDNQRAYGLRREFRKLCALRPREIGALLVATYKDWSADGVSSLGAALSYFTLFSIAPVLIVVTGVAGLFIGHAAATGQVSPWLERFLSPQGAEAAQLMLQQAATPTRGIVTTIGGVLTLFLGTSALVGELRHSLNVVWRIQEPASQEAGIVASIRVMASDRLYAFLIVVGAGLLVLASLALNTAVTAIATYFHNWLPIPAVVLQIINFVVSFAVMTAVFTLVYKTVPDAYVAWGDAGIGALATAFLFSAGTMTLSIFLGTTGGSIYGPGASVLALLLWVYYSAQVFFFGAELTRIFANTYGAHIVPYHRSLAVIWRRRPA